MIVCCRSYFSRAINRRWSVIGMGCYFLFIRQTELLSSHRGPSVVSCDVNDGGGDDEEDDNDCQPKSSTKWQ